MKVKLWITCAVAIVLAGGFLQCRNSRVGNDNNSAPNCYERAQSASVLVVCPDKSTGTGVIVERSGKLFVWTAAHVVSDTDSVNLRSYIRHNDKQVGHVEFTGKVIARNDSLDVALLWLDAPVKFFDTREFMPVNEQLRVGQSVYHVGNFWGADFNDSVSVGIISQLGVRPNSPHWPWAAQMHQTTTFVTYGSSGGAVFRHSDDKVIGIIVGSPAPGQSDVNLFVPVPDIFRWAQKEGLQWAVYGDYAPSDSLLEQAAELSARERKLRLPQPPIASPD